MTYESMATMTYEQIRDDIGDAATQAAAIAAVQAAAGQILDPDSAVAAGVGDGTIMIGDTVIPGTFNIPTSSQEDDEFMGEHFSGVDNGISLNASEKAWMDSHYNRS